MRKIYIIAEIGVNHNGSLSKAYQLILKAKQAGADAVKFQTFKTENLLLKNTKKATYQIKNSKDKENQFDMLKKLEISFKFQKKLFFYSKKNNIDFISSPFDLESIDFLKKLKLKYLKIPSGEITNIPYLQKIAKIRNKKILSTGCSEVSEIENALKILTKNGTLKKNITLLHCNSSYPTPLEDVNLNSIKYLQKKFNITVGFSDHTIGIDIPIAAASLGADIIEKHFTLNKRQKGPDHKVSLTPAEFKRMVLSIRNIEKAFGSYDKKVTKSEFKNRYVIRKSIFANLNIEKNDIFTEKNLITKRPGHFTSSVKWNTLIGKKSKKKYIVDDPINE